MSPRDLWLWLLGHYIGPRDRKKIVNLPAKGGGFREIACVLFDIRFGISRRRIRFRRRFFSAARDEPCWEKISHRKRFPGDVWQMEALPPSLSRHFSRHNNRINRNPLSVGRGARPPGQEEKSISQRRTLLPKKSPSLSEMAVFPQIKALLSPKQ
ncbi:hypothetical protein CEXT_654621 [Caerostris extrusa]|uniref:Uncharacterized protein n=1 Tax=Caerostris extrusa TaxID=172846 RepID=A0AAV4PJT7_CAEEX|nr:hypothetical protein CEXT_654621 [Caerostris extrusa]